ncbi:MAG: helix-turn-helix domain-containing protein [Oscillospiraceae bacterium]
MNYAVLDKLCQEHGTTPTALALKLGLSKGNTTSWKKGGNPSVEVLLQISDELNCTTDYLLKGKEKSSKSNLSDLELEALEKFNKLEDVDKGRILDRMETIFESYSPEQKENVS